MCPACGYIVNAAADIFDSGSAGPEVGDLSICLNCGELMVIMEHSQLASATDDDRNDLSPDAERAIAAIKMRGRFRDR